MNNDGIKKKSIPKPTHFGKNLKFLRRLSSLSQTGLANALEIKRSNIASYESGIVEPKASLFLKTCIFFSKAPAEMLETVLSEQAVESLPISLPENNTKQAILNEQSNTYTPIYVAQNEGLRIPNYHRMDISISRIFGLPFGSAIVYANVNNLLDFKNVRDYNYNMDYSQRFAEYLNRRVIFFGVVLNWE